MVVGIILQQVATHGGKFAGQASKYLDYIYAGAIGTGIGIGLNPEVRQAYEYWKGKNKGMSWRDKIVRRRFKGDVFIDESSNTQPEALRTAEPITNRPKRRTRYYNFTGYRRRKQYTYASKRRCYCKGNMGRNVARSRQRKRTRKFYRRYL